MLLQHAQLFLEAKLQAFSALCRSTAQDTFDAAAELFVAFHEIFRQNQLNAGLWAVFGR
jgi:hypothetical protein